jgi:hypothetical protein
MFGFGETKREKEDSKEGDRRALGININRIRSIFVLALIWLTDKEQVEINTRIKDIHGVGNVI